MIDDILLNSPVAFGPDQYADPLLGLDGAPSDDAFVPPASDAPVSADDLAALKRRYSSLLIQLDRIRPELIASDSTFRSTPETWSIREMLGHIIDADRAIWWPRITALLEVDGVRFSQIDQNELVRRSGWQGLPVEDILSQLMRIRWSYAMKLNEISAEHFYRSGEHHALGTLSLARILQILVAHDAHYISKIRAAIAASKERPHDTAAIDTGSFEL